MLAITLAVASTTACTGGVTVGPGTTDPTESGGAGGTPPGEGGSGGHTSLGGKGGNGGNESGGAGGGISKGGAGGRDAGASQDVARFTRDAAGRTDTATGGKRTIPDGGAVACDDIESPNRLAVYYYSNSSASGSSIQMYFDVVNWTAFSAKLSQVTVRYWFTDEGAPAANILEQYYVPLPTTMKFITLNPPRENADTVLEISFSGTGTFVETRGFNFAFHKRDYTGNYTQANDYSYDPKLKTSLGQNPKITAYIAGELAWGCEPGAAAAPSQPIDGGTLDGGRPIDGGVP